MKLFFMLDPKEGSDFNEADQRIVPKKSARRFPSSSVASFHDPSGDCGWISCFRFLSSEGWLLIRLPS